jgi:predicted amidohydrolase
MRVTIVQSSLAWENPDQNRARFSQKISGLAGQTDLIVLPEMFTTGFSMRAAELAETMDGPTLRWLAETAEKSGAAVTGSFICSEAGHYYNRLVFMRPDGTFDTYDKRHLFGLAAEHEHYTPGKKRLTVEWKGWRICPLICYDLRFPAWSRNRVSNSLTAESAPYDLLIYVANWPARRSHHWKTLLTARAIENQSFTIGVNIYGIDGNGLEYTGDSAVVDFGGQPICQISGQEGVQTAELSLADQQHYRQQLPFLQDADVFTLH